MPNTKRPSQAAKSAAGTKAKKAAHAKKDHSTITIGNATIPTRFISAMVCLVLFLIFFIMLLRPDGVLVKLFYKFVLGMIGKVAYWLAIPGLLYLFSIHAFSGGRPIKMRTICLISFVLICGCIAHLCYGTKLPEGLPFIRGLYVGGVEGTTGGLICGLAGSLLHSLLGDWISLIFLVIGAVFTLLGSMQITVPSLVRAFENRPRAEWETKEAKEMQPEPAAIVVNHLATKRINMIENRRKAKESKTEIDIPLDGEKRSKPLDPKAKHMIDQIDEIETPVAAAEKHVTDVDDTVFNASPMPEKKKPRPAVDKSLPEPVPTQNASGMPLLEWEADDIDAPQTPPGSEPTPQKVTAKEAADSAAQVAQEIAQNAAAEKPVYCFPPIELLKAARRNNGDGTAEMRENSRRLSETLAGFKIEAHIINVTRGPSVTRYEVELEKGVRLNRLTTAANDIALGLGASGVRIAAVPGKISVVGIEVPNQVVTTVSLREVIDSPEFN